MTTNPAPWFVTGLGAVAALIASFGHLSTGQSAVVFSLATAIGTVITAFLTRPVSLSVIGGAAAIILGDFTLFGYTLTSNQIGAVVGLVTFLLGALLHMAGQPVASTPAVPARSSVPVTPAAGPPV
jgi:hypothetical protein